MKKRVWALLLCLCLSFSMIYTCIMAAGTQFTDVKSSDYFAVPVEWAVE